MALKMNKKAVPYFFQENYGWLFPHDNLLSFNNFELSVY